MGSDLRNTVAQLSLYFRHLLNWSLWNDFLDDDAERFSERLKHAIAVHQRQIHKESEIEREDGR